MFTVTLTTDGKVVQESTVANIDQAEYLANAIMNSLQRENGQEWNVAERTLVVNGRDYANEYDDNWQSVVRIESA